MNAQESYSRGFDHGNYGNAYESQDWESWWAENAGKCPIDANPQAWAEGCLLGFFSSYEIHEISDDMVAEEVAAVRARWGDES
jgi:hypothetical protein